MAHVAAAGDAKPQQHMQLAMYIAHAIDYGFAGYITSMQKIALHAYAN